MIRRREFIAGLGSAAAWPVVARAQQADRVRRIGVFIANVGQASLSEFTQALAGLGWTDGRNVRMDLRGAALTSIGYDCSRRSWLACSLTSSWQIRPR
jgi:putative ABC transport system substrate-binding protein